jgi:hypothetical protein
MRDRAVAEAYGIVGRRQDADVTANDERIGGWPFGDEPRIDVAVIVLGPDLEGDLVDHRRLPADGTTFGGERGLEGKQQDQE